MPDASTRIDEDFDPVAFMIEYRAGQSEVVRAFEEETRQILARWQLKVDGLMAFDLAAAPKFQDPLGDFGLLLPRKVRRDIHDAARHHLICEYLRRRSTCRGRLSSCALRSFFCIKTAWLVGDCWWAILTSKVLEVFQISK